MKTDENRLIHSGLHPCFALRATQGTASEAPAEDYLTLHPKDGIRLAALRSQQKR